MIFKMFSILILLNSSAGLLVPSYNLSIYITIGLSFSLFFISFIKGKNRVDIIKEKEQTREDKPSVEKEERVPPIPLNKWTTSDPLGEKRPVSCHDCTEKIYYIKNYIPLIKDMTIKTLDYEEQSMNSLFNSFQEISFKTDTIVNESKSSIDQIINPAGRNNLAYIRNVSKEIEEEFNRFISTIKHMSSVADSFINTTIESFQYISKTIESIVDLSEQVKVISINVRIEAARVKDSGGFKVLGSDISNFADKTSKIAISTNEQIQGAMSNIFNLKGDLVGQLNNVDSVAQSIYSKISPFENILETSSNSILEVIKKFNDVSSSLQTSLQYSINNMQYQDIGNQEINHILLLLDKIDKSGLLDRKFDLYMDENKQKAVKEDILDYLSTISTTVNEEVTLDKFREEWMIEKKTKDDSGATEVDKDVFLF